MIYEFRVKHGIKGVQSKHLEAPDLETAQKDAEAWASAIPGCTFIFGSVEPWLVTAPARAPALAAEAGDYAPRPDGTEQRKRHRAAAVERATGTGIGSLPAMPAGRVGQ